MVRGESHLEPGLSPQPGLGALRAERVPRRYRHGESRADIGPVGTAPDRAERHRSCQQRQRQVGQGPPGQSPQDAVTLVRVQHAGRVRLRGELPNRRPRPVPRLVGGDLPAGPKVDRRDRPAGLTTDRTGGAGGVGGAGGAGGVGGVGGGLEDVDGVADRGDPGVRAPVPVDVVVRVLERACDLFVRVGGPFERRGELAGRELAGREQGVQRCLRAVLQLVDAVGQFALAVGDGVGRPGPQLVPGNLAR